MTRIVSWNVNGIRSCSQKGLFGWLTSASPDMLCLQETKAQKEQLGKEYFSPPDSAGKPYASYWADAKKRGYSGVAIYSRREPEALSTLGIPEFDDEGRFLAADFGDFLLASAYFPNSQDAGARIDYKIRFCDAVLAWCDDKVKAGRHIVVGGDYNIAHTPLDLANPKANEGNPGYLPEERAWMEKYTVSGYADSFRHFNKEGKNYTWWTYRVPSARERNIGWRLDYHCVDEALVPAMLGAAIHADVPGSDHCPVSIDLDFSP
jgi:exodeoxyribonuclease-3